MAKLTLTPIGSFTQTAVTTINANMDAIETAIENTLSRDGTTPNQMTADIDLNNNDILNVNTLDVDIITLAGETLIPGDISSGTAAEILTAIKTVDGAGSGLDADLLDGQHGTFYLDRTNHTGTQASTTVTNTQTGTGATSRTVQNKFVEHISIRDFGAVGDGTTDDTLAIQKALDAIKAQGGGTLFIPASANVYKITSGLTYDVSALSGRFTSRLQIIGDGPNSCISLTGVAASALTITGNASFPEMYCHFESFRLTGNNTVGSKGLVLSISAFGSSDGLIIEAFDFNLDCTDVEQIRLANSNFRWGLHGARFNASIATTSANSIVFDNCAFANNATYGLSITNANAVTFVGGSTQYNGTTGGGSTMWGAKIIESGNGYGTVLFKGHIFEGNGGDADFISEQSANICTVSFDGVGFTRPNDTNFATNFVKIDGSTASIYTLSGCTLRGYNTYVPNAGRPYIAFNNAAAKFVDTGDNVYGSATEAPVWGVNLALVPNRFSVGARTTLINSASFAVNATTDKNFFMGANVNLADGVAVGSINDANAVLKGFEIRASAILLGAPTTVTGALSPTTTDGGALGSASLMWSDLFVASGAVLNFNNGNYTVTHSAGTLTFSGGASWGAALLPTIDDGAAIGSLSLRWSDLFLAAGAVINFGGNDATLSHVAGSQIRIAGNFGRGAPVTKTGNFSVGVAENWLIVNQAGTTTVTLPAAATWTGREIMIKTIQAQTVISASSNVVPRAGGAAGTAILAATAGNWATLVSDGTNWIIMQGTP